MLEEYFIYIQYLIMTGNVIQQKRNRGKPKKYHNDEDRRLAYNVQLKECMLGNPFHCDICNRTYHMASKHLRSNKHINNAQYLWLLIILRWILHIKII